MSVVACGFRVNQNRKARVLILCCPDESQDEEQRMALQAAPINLATIEGVNYFLMYPDADHDYLEVIEYMRQYGQLYAAEVWVYGSAASQAAMIMIGFALDDDIPIRDFSQVGSELQEFMNRCSA